MWRSTLEPKWCYYQELHRRRLDVVLELVQGVVGWISLLHVTLTMLMLLSIDSLSLTTRLDAALRPSIETSIPRRKVHTVTAADRNARSLRIRLVGKNSGDNCISAAATTGRAVGSGRGRKRRLLLFRR